MSAEDHESGSSVPGHAACAVRSDHAESDRVSEAAHFRVLLRRIANSDQAAFAELFDATSPRLHGMVLRVLRNPGYSEETTQEVYLQIWRDASRYDADRGSPLSWMMTLAHRRAVDRVRSEQAGANREALYGSSTYAPAHDQVYESVLQQSETDAVVRCLSSLTDTQHESVQLAYYQGLTYQQVAERLGVGLPTVKSRIREGLIKLKRCLGVSGDE